MKIAKLLLAASTAAALSSPMSAFALNDTAASAIGMGVNEPWRTAYFDATAGYSTTLYYWSTVYAGRSYCAETSAYSYETATADTVINVYTSALNSVIVANDDKGEPGNTLNYGKQFGTSRACWIASATGYVVVSVYAYQYPKYYNFRIVETTEFNPWYFRVASHGYDAYATIRNTTSNAVNFTLTARDFAGTTVGSTTGTLAANGGTYVPVSSLISGDGYGSWQLSHDGAPGALAAGQTTMSVTTGLSFDTQFLPRTSIND